MKVDFNSILNNNNITLDQTKQLEEFLNEYPYCNVAQMLYLKGLQNQESFLYNSYLKRVAAYSPNRHILFEYITQIPENTIKNNNGEERKILKQPNYKEKLEIGKPLNFKEDEMLTFNEWLHLTKIKPIKRTKENKTEEKIISEFLKKPINKINLKKDDISETVNIAEIPVSTNVLVTETLARIYIEQELWDKAIKTYEILILKYPEKSSLFAAKIKEIKKIK